MIGLGPAYLWDALKGSYTYTTNSLSSAGRNTTDAVTRAAAHVYNSPGQAALDTALWTIQDSPAPKKSVPEEVGKKKPELSKLTPSQRIPEYIKNFFTTSSTIKGVASGYIIGCYTGQPLNMSAAGAIVGGAMDAVDIVPDGWKELANKTSYISGVALGLWAFSSIIPNSLFETSQQPIKNPDTSFYKAVEAIDHLGTATATAAIGTAQSITTAITPDLQAWTPREISALWRVGRNIYDFLGFPGSALSHTVGMGGYYKFSVCVALAFGINHFVMNKSSSLFPEASKILSDVWAKFPEIFLLSSLFAGIKYVEDIPENSWKNTAIQIAGLASLLIIHPLRNFYNPPKVEKEPDNRTTDELLKAILQRVETIDDTFLPEKLGTFNHDLFDRTDPLNPHGLDPQFDLLVAARGRLVGDALKTNLSNSLKNREKKLKLIQTFYQTLPNDAVKERELARLNQMIRGDGTVANPGVEAQIQELRLLLDPFRGT